MTHCKLQYHIPSIKIRARHLSTTHAIQRQLIILPFRSQLYYPIQQGRTSSLRIRDSISSHFLCYRFAQGKRRQKSILISSGVNGTLPRIFLHSSQNSILNNLIIDRYLLHQGDAIICFCCSNLYRQALPTPLRKDNSLVLLSHFLPFSFLFFKSFILFLFFIFTSYTLPSLLHLFSKGQSWLSFPH